MCIHFSLRKQKCRLKSTTTNGWRHFGQSEQRKSFVLFPIQSEKSPDSGFFTCDPTKKCIMPFSRERHKGKIGRGHDLSLRFDTQDDTVVEIWLSKDSVGSKITPTSLTDWPEMISFPSGDNLKSSYFEYILRLPKTISFVFSELSIKQLSKQQLRLRCKSELTLSIARVESFTVKKQ